MILLWKLHSVIYNGSSIYMYTTQLTFLHLWIRTCIPNSFSGTNCINELELIFWYMFFAFARYSSLNDFEEQYQSGSSGYSFDILHTLLLLVFRKCYELGMGSKFLRINQVLHRLILSKIWFGCSLDLLPFDPSCHCYLYVMF